MTVATHRLGKDFRLMVAATGATPTYIQIGGEMSLSRTSSSDKIDTSSKDDGTYKTQTYGQKEITLAVQGVLKLPDPGFGLIYTTQKASPPELLVQIIGPSSTIVFAALMAIGNYKDDFSDKSAATYSFDLSLAGVPTIDDMTLITS